MQSYLDDDSGSIPTRSRYAFIMTMCGIHGTISLSMALTLPELVGQQQHFEYRNDLLFIAALMVLISLILAQIILPLITPSAHETDFQGAINRQRFSLYSKSLTLLKKSQPHSQTLTIDQF